MTDFIVTSPDGAKYKVTAPPGKTEQDALAYVKQNHDQLKALPPPGPAGGPEAEAEFGPNTPSKYGGKGALLPPPEEKGSGVEAAPPPGPNWKAAQDQMRTLLAAGKGPGTPEFDAAAKQRAAGLQRLSTGGLEMLGGGGGAGAGVRAATEIAPVAVKAAAGLPGQLMDLGSKIAPGATGRAVEKLTKIGLPDTPSVLGARIHDTLAKKLTAATQARSAEAAQNFANFAGKTETVEPILSDYRSAVKTLMKDRGKDLSTEEAALVQSSLKELHGDRSLVAIDKERRRLNAIADSGAFEGHSAIKKTFARELADTLTDIMTSRNDAAGKYLADYKAASEPINLYSKTALGKAATAEKVPNITATDAALLPNRFFNTAQSVQTLKKLAGDDDFVNAAARIHAASQMERLTMGKSIDAAAKQATMWARKQKSWLDELPDVKADVEKYTANLRKTAQTQKYAKTAAGAGAVGMLLYEGKRPYYWIRSLLGIP